MSFRAELLYDPNIKWLFQKRIREIQEKYEIEESVELEWENLITILTEAAKESLGIKKRWNRKRGLRIWDEHIKKIMEDKRHAYKRFLATKKDEDFIDYERKRAIAKKETRKRHREQWENFVNNLERDITKPSPI
jgi:uncharacterized protein YecA (UPF0149 family)